MSVAIITGAGGDLSVLKAVCFSTTKDSKSLVSTTITGDISLGKTAPSKKLRLTEKEIK